MPFNCTVVIMGTLDTKSVEISYLSEVIHQMGMKAGVALNPHTPVSLLEEVIADLDMVLIMSVNPGFGGQSFIRSSLSKIRRLKKMIDKSGSNAVIEVDGGVDITNARLLFDAGVNVLVAGSAVFKAPNPTVMISLLKNAYLVVMSPF